MATHGKHYDLLKNFQLLSESENILARTDQLNLIRKEIKANIAKAYDKNERQYNLRTREISFKVGQEVFRRNFSQSNFSKQINAKLNPQVTRKSEAWKFLLRLRRPTGAWYLSCQRY